MIWLVPLPYHETEVSLLNPQPYIEKRIRLCYGLLDAAL